MCPRVVPSLVGQPCCPLGTLAQEKSGAAAAGSGWLLQGWERGAVSIPLVLWELRPHPEGSLLRGQLGKWPSNQVLNE